MGDTDLVLFNHEVILVQSGAPVLAANSSEVVGFIEGQWLRPAAGLVAEMQQGAGSVGAAVPIRYAIGVLRSKGIEWSDTNASPSAVSAEANGSGRPDPVQSRENSTPQSSLAPLPPAWLKSAQKFVTNASQYYGLRQTSARTSGHAISTGRRPSTRAATGNGDLNESSTRRF